VEESTRELLELTLQQRLYIRSPCQVDTTITMSREVQVKKASELNAPSGGQTDGMTRINAIVDMSDQICGSGEYSMMTFARRLG
jgi:hypothetical protein